MAYEQILSEVEGNLLILTLNRPERLNAWTHKMNRELSDAIIEANENPEIGAIIITGTGERTAESYDEGRPTAAPLLHVEYTTRSPVNQAPIVDAGVERTISLPEARVFLDGTVKFVEYPGPWPMTEKFIKALESLDELKVKE